MNRQIYNQFLLLTIPSCSLDLKLRKFWATADFHQNWPEQEKIGDFLIESTMISETQPVISYIVALFTRVTYSTGISRRIPIVRFKNRLCSEESATDNRKMGSLWFILQSFIVNLLIIGTFLICDFTFLQASIIRVKWTRSRGVHALYCPQNFKNSNCYCNWLVLKGKYSLIFIKKVARPLQNDFCTSMCTQTPLQG